MFSIRTWLVVLSFPVWKQETDKQVEGLLSSAPWAADRAYPCVSAAGKLLKPDLHIKPWGCLSYCCIQANKLITFASIHKKCFNDKENDENWILVKTWCQNILPQFPLDCGKCCEVNMGWKFDFFFFFLRRMEIIVQTVDYIQRECLMAFKNWQLDRCCAEYAIAATSPNLLFMSYLITNCQTR